MKLDSKVFWRYVFLRLQSSLVLFISTTKLAILQFLFCGHFVKTSIGRFSKYDWYFLNFAIETLKKSAPNFTMWLCKALP